MREMASVPEVEPGFGSTLKEMKTTSTSQEHPRAKMSIRVMNQIRSIIRKRVRSTGTPEFSKPEKLAGLERI